ncbi:hypothetical protein [Bacillus sp. JCM 19034]|nr:hypothetical protein [Bacillus sp. JCM 19034]
MNLKEIIDKIENGEVDEGLLELERLEKKQITNQNMKLLKFITS